MSVCEKTGSVSFTAELLVSGSPSHPPKTMKLSPRAFGIRVLHSLLAVFGAASSMAQQSVVINYGDVWKYNLPAGDPGTSWRNVGFNDTSWSSGPGFLGYETATLPAPGIQTAVGNSTINQPVYLFRKTFTFAGEPSGATFAIDHLVDDSVTYYLNGTILGSVRHTPGTWNNNAFTFSTEGVIELNILSGAATSLVFGTNVLAAEVHQVSSPNSDMVFGSKLKITSIPLTSSNWRMLNFGTTSNSGNAADLADGDNDGLENLMEYALMLDPTKPSSIWNSLTVQGSNHVLTYSRRKSALNEVAISVIWSAEMAGPWSNTGVTEEILSDDGVVQSVKALIPTNGAGRRFFKIQVVRPLVVLPATPASITATTFSDKQINLTWTDSSNNETGFKIERRQSGTTTWVQIATPAANATSFSNTGLTGGTKYYYKVRATNDAGDSTFSPEANATTQVTPTAPAAPSGLTASAASSSQINLTWTDGSNNETGFKLERRQSGSTTWTQIATPAANATSCSNTGLSAATKYYYRIRATNVVGDSVFSGEADATTPVAAPSAPSSLVANGVSSGQINLAWSDNSNNETDFKLERKTGSGGTYSQIALLAANTVAYSDYGVTASSQYFYRIRATNAGGDSVFSSEANATTQAAGTGTMAPVIMASGYDKILNVQITGSSGNWRISDTATQQLQSGYEWWYFVGSKIIKTSSNLSNEPWRGNHPGRVLKMAGKIGLDTFNRWSNEGGWYYDANAGMYFDHADVGGVTTFMFR